MFLSLIVMCDQVFSIQIPGYLQNHYISDDVDIFGQTPFTAPPTNPNIVPTAPVAPVPTNPFASPAPSADPFGMGSFTPSSASGDLDQQIQSVDRELLDLQVSRFFFMNHQMKKISWSLDFVIIKNSKKNNYKIVTCIEKQIFF